MRKEATLSPAIYHDRFPENVPVNFVSPPHGLYLIAVSEAPHRYFAIRDTAPAFIIEADDPVTLDATAGLTIRRFLDRMHQFGFRRA